MTLNAHSAPAPTIVRCKDSAAVAAQAAEALDQVVRNIQADAHGGSHGDGMPRIVVTGGGAGTATLGQCCKRWADDPDIDLSMVHFFFGDERWVLKHDDERNDHAAYLALFNHLPPTNVHTFAAPENSLDEDPHSEALEQARQNYEDCLATAAPQGFDVHLLGMGPEGHINSLFPHTDETAQTQGTVAIVRDCPKPPPTRLTLTLPAVCSSDRVWLLVTGEAKAPAVAAAVGEINPDECPASGARGRNETRFFVDPEAASQLD